MPWVFASVSALLIGSFVWVHFTSTNAEGIGLRSRMSELLDVVGIVLFLTAVGERYLSVPVSKHHADELPEWLLPVLTFVLITVYKYRRQILTKLRRRSRPTQ